MNKFNLPLFVLILLFNTTLLAQVKSTQPQIMPSNNVMALNTLSPLDLDHDKIPTRIGHEGIDALYRRFEQHFGDFIGENPKRKVDYQFIMDKETSFETFELQELYQVAMEEGLPLERFDKFGTVQLGEGRFEYDLELTPFIADAKRLFSFLRHPRPISDHFLLPRGFRPNDIDIIRQYIKNNDVRDDMEQQQFNYLISRYKTLKTIVDSEHILAPQLYHHQLSTNAYVKSYIMYTAQRNWAIGLMQRLDKQRQRILQRVLIEQLDGERTGTNRPKAANYTYLVEQMRSGEFKQWLLKSKYYQPKLHQHWFNEKGERL